MRRICVADITLKTLSEDRATALLFREKAAIAGCAAHLGVDAVELPAVKSPREDAIIGKTIAGTVGRATLAIPVGHDVAGVAAAFECVRDAASPRLQVELPVSTIQMEYSYHVKQNKMLEKIGELVAAAATYTADVEFSALDATRADLDFLLAAVRCAEEKGAGLVTLCDDAGTATPEEIGALVAAVRAAVTVPVYVRLSDRIRLAVASAFAAIAAGADGLKCAMVGGDALLTAALSDAVSACGTRIGAELRLNDTRIHASIDDLLSSIRHTMPEQSETVSEAKRILLDADATIAQVAEATTLLGYELSDADVGNVHRALVQVCERKGAVGSRELEALIASSAMQAPSTYHFESYTTTSSNISSAMTQVVLTSNGETLRGVSTGDGPIDSAFRAIEQGIGHHYELDDFQVQSVTEGKEALGSALVRLRVGGKLFSGNGLSTDIVAASIRAYVNALNKIVFEEA